jgi:hypothetical protein
MFTVPIGGRTGGNLTLAAVKNWPGQDSCFILKELVPGRRNDPSDDLPKLNDILDTWQTLSSNKWHFRSAFVVWLCHCGSSIALICAFN